MPARKGIQKERNNIKVSLDECKVVDDKTWYTPAQPLVTIVQSSGFWPTGERSSRNLHAAASRTAEERERVRMRAHHARHLILATGQNKLTGP
jgi:hypothetical protein